MYANSYTWGPIYALIPSMVVPYLDFLLLGGRKLEFFGFSFFGFLTDGALLAVAAVNFVVGLVYDNFKLVDKVDCPANSQRPDAELVADIIMLCKKVMEKNNLTEKDIESIGIGIPGCHNPETGVVLYCANINFHNTPISDMIRKEIDTSNTVSIGFLSHCPRITANNSGTSFFGKKKKPTCLTRAAIINNTIHIYIPLCNKIFISLLNS